MEEKVRIRKFAHWGRFPLGDGRPRASVIVFTGVELFSEWHLDETWKRHGGRHAVVADASSVHLDELSTLADYTQQFYLDMPSYSRWHQERALRLRLRTE